MYDIVIVISGRHPLHDVENILIATGTNRKDTIERSYNEVAFF